MDNSLLCARHLQNECESCESAREASVELIILIVILVLLFGSIPHYGYSRNWGYFPSGTLGTILLIFLILWLLHVV
jgi:hypothetical protein